MATNGVTSATDAIQSSSKTILDSLSISKTTSSGSSSGIDSVVSSSVDSVAISASGRKINELYDELRNITDPEERKKAMAGFRDVMMDFASGSDAEKVSNFVRTMDDLKTSDKATFENFFSTARDVKEGGYGLGSYVDTFLKIEDRSLQKSFVSETDSIINDETASRGEKQSTYDNFIGSVNSVLDQSGLEDSERLDLMRRFFDEVSQGNSLEEKDDAMTRFKEEELSESDSDSE